jgi:hypothetical protein
VGLSSRIEMHVSIDRVSDSLLFLIILFDFGIFLLWGVAWGMVKHS